MQIGCTIEQFCVLEQGSTQASVPRTLQVYVSMASSSGALLPPPFFFLRTAYLHSVSAGCTTKLLQCPQMKAECQTFEVEGFFFCWHLATPRSLLQSCNGVWTVWGERAAVSGSLLLGERARGTRRPPLSHCTPHPAHFRTRRLAPCGGQS